MRWPLPFAAAVLLTAACQTPLPQPSVVFDESLDEFFSIHDPGALGYSRAAAALVRAGYSVTANRAPLARTLAGLADPRRAALVLGSRLGTSLGQPSLAALRAFLARGGAVVFFAEHDNAYGNATALNELLAGFGVRIRSDRLQASLDPRLSPGPITIAASHLTRGDSIVLYLGTGIDVRAPAAAILAAAPDGTPVAVTAAAGAGHVTVIGDSEFLWNGSERFGVRVAGNLRFFLDAIRLAIGSGAPGRRSEKEKPRSESTRPSVVFALEPAGSEPLESPGAYRKLFSALRSQGLRVVVGDHLPRDEHLNALLVVEPAAPLPSDLGLAFRVVAIANATSGGEGDVAGLVASLARGGFLDPEDHPLNGTLGPLGIRVLPGVLRTPAGAFSLAARRTAWPVCAWERAAPLVVSESAGAKALAEWEGSSDRELLHLTTRRRPGRLLRAAPGSSGTWPLVVESPRTFVLASASVVADDEWDSACGGAIAQAIAAWVRGNL